MTCSHSQGPKLLPKYCFPKKLRFLSKFYLLPKNFLSKGDTPISLIYSNRDLNCNTFPSPLIFWRCVVFISLLWIRPSYQFSWSAISLPFFRSSSHPVLLLIFSSTEWYKIAFIIHPAYRLTTQPFLSFYILFPTLVPHIVSFCGL